MLDPTAIAAATATLRRLLLDGLPKQDSLLAQVDVTSLPPDKVNANVDRATLNVFLYRVATSPALKNRYDSGAIKQGASETPLTLHYLLTAYGRVDQEAGDLSHRVLGAAMSVLHASAVVNQADLDAMLPFHAGLAASRSLRITAANTGLEEMATIWSMFHTSYRLSASYEVSVVGTNQTREDAPRLDGVERRNPEKFAAALQALGLAPEAAGVMQQLRGELGAATSTQSVALFAEGSAHSAVRAAQLLASETDRDLHRVDLSKVVSQYIGETEKNLRRVFDEADAVGAILFFDEADALFGKRSEVRDSHDRYANIEVNYLLQRLEEFGGLTILATNRKADLDPAFLRRTRYVVDFPTALKD